MTQIELKFEKGGKFTATLLEDKAPKTCEAIVNALPVSGKLLHAKCAGAEYFFERFPAEDDVPFENTTCRMDENLAITNKHPGGILAYWPNPKVKSFCIVYGEFIPRMSVDVEVALNIFAEIDDMEKAVEVGRRIRHQGSESVTIRVKK